MGARSSGLKVAAAPRFFWWLAAVAEPRRGSWVIGEASGDRLF